MSEHEVNKKPRSLLPANAVIVGSKSCLNMAVKTPVYEYVGGYWFGPSTELTELSGEDNLIAVDTVMLWQDFLEEAKKSMPPNIISWLKEDYIPLGYLADCNICSKDIEVFKGAVYSNKNLQWYYNNAVELVCKDCMYAIHVSSPTIAQLHNIVLQHKIAEFKTKQPAKETDSANTAKLLPDEDTERRKYQIGTFLSSFFPHANMEVAKFAFEMQKKHAPDKEMFWAKDKSIGDGNQLMRHLITFMYAVHAGDKKLADEEIKAVHWRAGELHERWLLRMPPFNK